MNYTLELQKRITKKYQKGESVSNLSKYYNIPRTSIYNWINKLSKKSFHELSISKRQLMSIKER